mmetsp:Transcript_72904/g.118269  ORF Transcript_72904/g.118269 Transcript_72904/m.118269 type:complete len:82 (+) Transcript_72904:257-502(+)
MGHCVQQHPWMEGRVDWRVVRLVQALEVQGGLGQGHPSGMCLVDPSAMCLALPTEQQALVAVSHWHCARRHRLAASEEQVR